MHVCVKQAEGKRSSNSVLNLGILFPTVILSTLLKYLECFEIQDNFMSECA